MASFIMRYWMKVRGGGSAVYTPSGDVPANALLETTTGDALLETTTGEYLLETA